jgi:predicted lipoprotein
VERSASTISAPGAPSRSRRGPLVAAILVLLVVGAMAYDTTVVTIGSEADVRGDVFSPEAFAREAFPAIRDSIVERAIEAPALAAAVAADKAAAAAEYGVPAGIGAVIPVAFEGTLGEGKSGIYSVAVDGLPEDVQIRVQTGPAINGTELRDATGEIQFGDFTNQIEYQNAAAALNDAMKEEVLAGVDTSALAGKTVSVTGVFTLINPKNWLVTPVRFEAR